MHPESLYAWFFFSEYMNIWGTMLGDGILFKSWFSRSPLTPISWGKEDSASLLLNGSGWSRFSTQPLGTPVWRGGAPCYFWTGSPSSHHHEGVAVTPEPWWQSWFFIGLLWHHPGREGKGYFGDEIQAPHLVSTNTAEVENLFNTWHGWKSQILSQPFPTRTWLGAGEVVDEGAWGTAL